MPQFMSVEVSGEQIADLMAEDGAFAFEVWATLAERLNMGALADDLSDLLSAHQNKPHARQIARQFSQTFETINSLHFSQH